MNWNPPETVASTDEGIVSKPSLALTGLGDPAVAYLALNIRDPSISPNPINAIVLALSRRESLYSPRTWTNHIVDWNDPTTSIGTIPNWRGGYHRPQLAIGNNGRFHMLYTRYGDLNTLVYATWDGQSVPQWTYTKIADDSRCLALALDNTDSPHVARGGFNDSVYYASATNGWVNELITDPSTPHICKHLDIAISSGGDVNVSYHDEWDDTLCYAYRHSGASNWNRYALDGPRSGETGTGISCLNDLAKVAYVHSVVAEGNMISSLKVRETTIPGFVWQTTTIDDSEGFAMYPSLRIYDADHASISYIGKNGVKFAHSDQGLWQYEYAVQGPWSGDTSLALDASDRPYIAYVAPTSRQIMCVDTHPS